MGVFIGISAGGASSSDDEGCQKHAAQSKKQTVMIAHGVSPRREFEFVYGI